MQITEQMFTIARHQLHMDVCGMPNKIFTALITLFTVHVYYKKHSEPIKYFGSSKCSNTWLEVEKKHIHKNNLADKCWCQEIQRFFLTQRMDKNANWYLIRKGRCWHQNGKQCIKSYVSHERYDRLITNALRNQKECLLILHLTMLQQRYVIKLATGMTDVQSKFTNIDSLIYKKACRTIRWL